MAGLLEDKKHARQKRNPYGKIPTTPTSFEGLPLPFDNNLLPTDRVITDIVIDELTNGDKQHDVNGDPFWQGTAILDTLIKVLGTNIEIQYEMGRIVGQDYASTYIQMLGQALDGALKFLQLGKDLSLQQRQVDLAEAKTAREILGIEEQVKLKVKELEMSQRKIDIEESISQRQIQGYDENIAIKLLDIEINAFATIYSSGMLDGALPDVLNAATLNEAFKILACKVNDHDQNVEEKLHEYYKGVDPQDPEDPQP